MKPRLVAETESYAVVYKPPFMHTAPLREGEKGTLLDWFGAVFPPVLKLEGRKKIEGGLVHRLDFETEGLTLIAKKQDFLDAFLLRREKELFVKEYGAIVSPPGGQTLPGFPPPPPFSPLIESGFRPYGRGRKTVRPLTGKTEGKETDEKVYRTEILESTELDGARKYLRLRIQRGFRHQIRCHLAWIGAPILYDPLYRTDYRIGAENGAERKNLALRCEVLAFADLSGVKREYRISPLIRDYSVKAGGS
ncbi:MAG: RNA pseudouridine synthase [Treponema sp.]|jgi:23S rRNA pseudouridine1911/1915/1917 synthase|nr:RNA pseudouridine synthase [Treponema sp.]